MRPGVHIRWCHLRYILLENDGSMLSSKDARRAAGGIESSEHVSNLTNRLPVAPMRADHGDRDETDPLALTPQIHVNGS
jgi:hypothetical protein